MGRKSLEVQIDLICGFRKKQKNEMKTCRIMLWTTNNKTAMGWKKNSRPSSRKAGEFEGLGGGVSSPARLARAAWDISGSREGPHFRLDRQTGRKGRKRGKGKELRNVPPSPRRLCRFSLSGRSSSQGDEAHKMGRTTLDQNK